jgi:glucosylceramidase
VHHRYTVAAGGTTQLTATVAPSTATNKNVSWPSSNNSIATVNSTGLVTGVASGTATITVTTQDGAKTATAAITVTAVTSSFPGYYNIFSRNSGKGLDVANNATDSGAQVQQYDVTNGGGSNQRWSFVSAGGNNYYIKVKSTQMCLAPSGSGTVNGEKVQQRNCGTGNEFKWTVTALGGGFYKITNVNSGKSLDVENVSTANGANIQVWDDNGGGLNQQWSFTLVETVAPLALIVAVPNEQNVLPAEKNVQISPNPARNYINISSDYLINGNVNVMSATGQTVITKQYKSDKTWQTINISSLPKGVYLIKVANKKGLRVIKFIKE